VFTKHAFRNTVIIIQVNSDYFSIFKNLLCSVNQMGADAKLILSTIVAQCLDQEVASSLNAIQEEHLKADDATFGIIK
jgi:hypothetical protein